MSKIKSALEKYQRHIRTAGPEFVLETAADDPEITDAAYAKLYKQIYPNPGRATSFAAKMADRNFASEAGVI